MKTPGALSTAIDDLLAALGLSNITLQARLGADWPAVVGPLLSSRTAPAKLRRGILTVAAENHTVSQELQFMKPALLSNVRALLGNDAVSDVRIVVGAVARRAEPSEPPNPEAGDIGLSSAADLDGLDAIPDAETREILRSISRKAASRR